MIICPQNHLGLLNIPHCGHGNREVPGSLQASPLPQGGWDNMLPCLPVTSLSQVQDRPHRALAYIVPSIGAAVLLNIPRWAAQQLSNQIIRFISPSIGDKLYLMFNNFQTSIMFDNRSENIENIKFEEFKGLIYFHDGMSQTKN